VALAEHGGSAAAARVLGTRHTSVNSQIQALEQAYGVELLIRNGRRLEVSAIGQQLLPLARRMVSLESDIGLVLAEGGALRRGFLRVAAVGPFHVTEMIESHHKLYPGIRLALTLGNSETVLENLDKYSCDVGVLASYLPEPRYWMKPYARYPVIAFVNVNHPYAGRAVISLKELASQPLLMREPGSTTRKALEDAFREHGLNACVSMEIGSREALREAVARGLGVGTVSRSEYVPDPRLRPLRIKDDVVSTHIHLCCLQERKDSRLIASFFEAADRCLAQSKEGLHREISRNSHKSVTGQNMHKRPTPL